MDGEVKTMAELAAETASMKGGRACPECGCKDFRVIRTWHVKSRDVFAKRQRVCRHCGEVVCNTREIIDE